jgi:nucleotide-binding universal stress UspA family protein
MIDLKRVVVATDFGKTSAAALRYGVEVAATFGASLHALHVITEPLHATWASYAPGATFLGAVERFKAAASDRLESLVPAEDLAAGRAVLATTWGDASDEILEYASDHDVDLIVCGTHGGCRWDHSAMGSVAESLVRRAPCPVLTVHHPEHEFILPDRTIDRSAQTIGRAALACQSKHPEGKEERHDCPEEHPGRD